MVYTRIVTAYTLSVIRSFRHKGLHTLFVGGKDAKISTDLIPRIVRQLDALHAVRRVAELEMPGFKVQNLKGAPTRYSLQVFGPFCLTFEWVDGDAWRVDLAQFD